VLSKILVAFDGSECSNRALDFALDLAEKYSASILALNVLQNQFLGYTADSYDRVQTTVSFPTTIGSVAVDFHKFHEGILVKASEKAAKEKPRVKVETLLKEGNPTEVIVDTAKSGGYDIIVLGHSGAGRLKEALYLGGTSERVAHSARCPVLIVR